MLSCEDGRAVRRLMGVGEVVYLPIQLMFCLCLRQGPPQPKNSGMLSPLQGY